MTLEEINENKTRINVKWDIHMKGFLWDYFQFL